MMSDNTGSSRTFLTRIRLDQKLTGIGAESKGESHRRRQVHVTCLGVNCDVDTIVIIIIWQRLCIY